MCIYIYKKKKEQLANVLMKETGNICMCAVASSAAEVHPTLAQRPSVESPKSRVATAHRRAHTDTHRHTNTPRAGRGAQPGPKSTDEPV